MEKILVTRSSMPELDEYVEEIKDIFESHWLTNMGVKHNELEEQLEAPKPFAIYCYDELSYNDIESAKALGLGIILVNTRSYSIDRNQGISQFDTMTFGKKEREYRYLKSSDYKDERSEI